MAKRSKYVIGIINPEKERNTIKYVTDIVIGNKMAKWETGKEAKVFESKQYAEDVAFGLCVNGYCAVVMIKQDYVNLVNPDGSTTEN